MVNLWIPLAVIIGSWVLSHVVTGFMNLLRKATSKTKTTLDDKIIDALKLPVRILFLFLGIFYAIYYVNPTLTVNGFSITELYIVLGILFVGFVLSRLIKTFLIWYALEIAEKTKSRLDNSFFPFIRKFISVMIYAIVFLIVLDRFGIEIGPLLASLGIAGLAVALALQDTLSNFFAGLYVVADQPLKVGNYVQLESGVSGFVDEIGWRSTRIRTLAGNLVIVPNSKISQTVLTNYDMPEAPMSLVVNVGISYNSDLEKAEKVIVDVARKIQKSVQGADKKFEPFVRYKEFADSSINLAVTLRVNNFVDQYLVQHEFMKELHKRFKKEKIEIPFPQRDIHIKKK